MWASQLARVAVAASRDLIHIASPAEVAEAVRFILKARSMTGSIVMLDGGQHLAWSVSGHAGLE